MIEIKLPNGIWSFDPDDQLGPEGGFGVVYSGKDTERKAIAVKKIRMSADDLAHRELDIANWMSGCSFNHLIPIFDAGQDSESGIYFVVMSKAEYSLQDEIEKDGPINDSQAAHILYEVACGLKEMQALVHRDLKPANILFHEGNWKIADFGIARFIENATSTRTLKSCLSYQYAAPEQWNLDRSTTATDIYALGCIGYFLLSGFPPFHGPSPEDYKNQHVHIVPPKLEGHSHSLCSLINMMMRKAPEARPNISRILSILDIERSAPDTQNNNHSFNALSNAGDIITRSKVEQEAKQALESTMAMKRVSIYNESLRILYDIMTAFKEKIRSSTPIVEINDTVINLGKAFIEYEYSCFGGEISRDEYQHPTYDIIAGAKIVLSQSNPSYIWSSTLLYFRNEDSPNDYRWYEVSFFDHPLRERRHTFEPFHLEKIQDIVLSLATGTHIYEVAYGPFTIDDEDIDTFCERWATLLARAALGQIHHPRRMPLSDNFFQEF